MPENEVIDGFPVMYGNMKVERIVTNFEHRNIQSMAGVRITNDRNETMVVRCVDDSGMDEDGLYDRSKMQIFKDGKLIDEVGGTHQRYTVIVRESGPSYVESPFKWAYEIATKEAQKYENECKAIQTERREIQKMRSAEEKAAKLAHKQAISDRFLNR